MPRADVWVFEASASGEALGGRPLAIVELFGDTPRALAVSADGRSVYAAVFHSGNQTTAVHEGVMCYGFVEDGLGGDRPCRVMDGISSPNGLRDGRLPGGRPGTGFNRDGEYQPWTAMIVGFDEGSGEWRDYSGRNFSNGIRFHLPDLDVFTIDAETLENTGSFAHVGTTLFNMAVNPKSGALYVSNTDAQNRVPFEGPGKHGGSTVQGDIARSQISVINPFNGSVNARHLNRHINYQRLKSPARVARASVATPTQLSVSQDGKQLYVAALGSDRVAVYSNAQLEQDRYWDGSGKEFDPYAAANSHIEVPGGPAGLWLAESAGEGAKLYVLTHYDNSIVTLDVETGEELQRLPMFSAEPKAVQAGRFMLYNAMRSSSNGEASCASCHVFGDTDHLAWDLGNPDEGSTRNTNPFPTENMTQLGCDFVGPDEPSCELLDYVNGNGELRRFASNKGPMFTQTLRGIATHGHMHWRGDRVTGYFGTDIDPDGDGNIDTGDPEALNERLSFLNFIVAFEGLLGLDVDLNGERTGRVASLERDMSKFADFALALQMPPNPVRQLDNSHSVSGQLGADFFSGPRRSDGLPRDYRANGPEPDGQTCEGCHGLDPSRGFYGTRGEVAHGGETLILKVPQLRNMYQKVGMFGLPNRPEFLPSHTREHQGDQVRGFGFLHDGATDSLLNFLRGSVFDNGQKPCPRELAGGHFGCEMNEGRVGIPNERVRQGLVDFLYEFDSDLAPIVGQQVTLSRGANGQRRDRLRLLEARAAAPFVSKTLGGSVTECDLVAHGVLDGAPIALAYVPAQESYQPDSRAEPPISSSRLLSRLNEAEGVLTFTCVPPGSGYRIALDRDGDGRYNRDE
ncbi:MAG: hypothetical protein AAGI11_22345 [Pseudomonadota bacterium]